MGQSEADTNNKYIICSKCKMKFSSDDDNFKNDFFFALKNLVSNFSKL